MEGGRGKGMGDPLFLFSSISTQNEGKLRGVQLGEKERRKKRKGTIHVSVRTILTKSFL